MENKNDILYFLGVQNFCYTLYFPSKFNVDFFRMEMSRNLRMDNCFLQDFQFGKGL